MVDIEIILAGLWIAIMLCYLYGDVFSIIQGHLTLGEMDGQPLTEKMTLVMAMIMTIPIIMIVLSLTLEYTLNKWINIIVAVIYFGFNLFSIKDYPIYEKFTLIVSMVFNLVIVFYAWNWVI